MSSASYDKPALPHFTGRGDLEATLLDVEWRYFWDTGRVTSAELVRRDSIRDTLATADTPPEEMR